MHVYIYIYILHSCSRYLFLSAALSVSLYISLACLQCFKQVTPVGFEPTQLALVELESTPLDHSAKCLYVLLLGIANHIISTFPDTRAHALTTTTNTRDTPWPVFTLRYFFEMRNCLSG